MYQQGTWNCLNGQAISYENCMYFSTEHSLYTSTTTFLSDGCFSLNGQAISYENCMYFSTEHSLYTSTTTFLSDGCFSLNGQAICYENCMCFNTEHSLYTSTTTFLSDGCFSFLPESPRWLLTRGRLDEAQKLIDKVAKVNGVAYTRSEAFGSINSSEDEPSLVKATPLQIFRFPRLLLRYMLLYITW